MQRCDDCRFVYDAVALSAIPARLRSRAAHQVQLLDAAKDAGLARRRPHPQVWSALEYACHVRDVLQVQRERLALALELDCPTFTPMNRDQRAIDDRYNDQPAEQVAEELLAAADRFAGALKELDAQQWARSGRYNWPEDAERTMAWLARHTLHELIHHSRDIQRGLTALRQAPPAGQHA